jgi:protein-tyrosine phosphatase
MREFDPEAPPEAEVPDPYYGGLDGFEKAYAIVERSVRCLLETLEDEG